MLILRNYTNKTCLTDTIYRFTNNQLVYQTIEHHMDEECSFFEELLIGKYVPLDLLYMYYLFYGSRSRIEHQHISKKILILAAHLSFVLLPRCYKPHLYLWRYASLSVSSTMINTTDRTSPPLLTLGK